MDKYSGGAKPSGGPSVAKPSGGPSVAPRVNEGDWICSDSDCANVNFSRRTSCNRCGQERAELKLKKKMGTEIGKSAADKSRGLFSADDWQCNKCANVNWSRRLSCNVCNAPRFGEVEARTGYGGGYNERGNVEYRPKRDSDDDEFDEFGRRKKKKNKEQPDKVMSIQRMQSLSGGSQQGETGSHQYSIHKKSAVTVEDSKIAKTSEHNSDNRSIEYMRESRYSRSSENSGEMLKKHPSNTFPHPVPERRQSDFLGDQYSGRTNEWTSSKTNLTSPRDCIMENRVSSTNELKYRFTGRTIDENFEVVYSINERVCAAAWAITSSCLASAEQFQNVFDKPAPDFKTIFAWRQRLVSTGCLVDSHCNVETPTPATSKENIRIQRKLGRRKRARYYEQRCETSESSSKETPKEVFKRKRSCSNSDKVLLEPIGQDDAQTGQKEKNNSINSSEDSKSDSKENQRDCRNKPNNDAYPTDHARSVTPELTTVRMDLANIVKSPQRPTLNNENFAEDVYFAEDIPKTKSSEYISNEESHFLVPDVPKSKKATAPPKSLEDSLKNVLEDIVSESERYSSDDASEVDYRTRAFTNSGTDNKRQQSPCRNKDSVDGNEDMRYHPTTTKATSPLPLPKQPNNINTSLQNKNMSAAMRRLYECMTAKSKESDGDSGLEYIPTKINPAMAKRNHHLFNNSDMEIDNVSDIFSGRSVTPLFDQQQSCIPALNYSTNLSDRESEMNSPNVFKIQKFEDYIPDDDALYKDSSSEELSDESRNTSNTAKSTEEHRVVARAHYPHDENAKSNSVSLQDTELATNDISHNIDETPNEVHVDDTTDEVPVDEIQCSTQEAAGLQDDDNIATEVEPVKDSNDASKIDFNSLASFLNMSNVNTEAITNALKALATAAQQSVTTHTGAKDNEDKSNDDCIQINDQNKEATIILDDSDEPKAPSIPFLSDMFDPGSPPDTETSKSNNDKPPEKITDLSNVQETNLDDLLDLPPVRPLGGFKSFAIPKPIMLNRLKGVNPSKEQGKERKSSEKRKKKKVKTGEGDGQQQKDEEDEESGDEGDLSKYDLWGSDEEQNNQDKPETSTSNNENVEKTSDIPTAEKVPSPTSKNSTSDNRRSRDSKKSPRSSSRSSSSSSSSSGSSSGPTPRNRFDDFNLNSEMSRAESADSSRSRSNSRDRKHRNSGRNDKHKKPPSGDNRKDNRHDRYSRPHHSNRERHRKDSDRRPPNPHRHRR